MSGDGDRANVVRLEVNLSRSVADALQESARLRGASLTEAIRQAIVLLHKADPPALITAADLNGTHQGKTITFISPEGWEVTGVFYNVEHFTSQADIINLTDAGPVAVKGQGATILDIGPFELNMTGAETVRVHP